MKFDDYSYLALMGIVIFDVATLSFFIFLWSIYRNSIITLVHVGFSTRKLRLKRMKKEEDVFFDKHNFDAVKPNKLFLKKETNPELALKKSFMTDKFDDRLRLTSSSIDNFGLYVKLHNQSIGTDDIPGARKLAKSLYKFKSKRSWWTYFLYDCSKRITNNEAILYLKFMGQNCKMMLMCLLSSVIINVLVFLVFLFQGDPGTFLSYTFHDMLNCKTTTWALYINTWVYSIIAYYFILKFRNNIEGNKQVSAILRPQLHTIMVSGFSKTVTDPAVMYRHFDNYFPGQVISVHLVKDHGRRLLLENKLECLKKQLAGLYDAVSAPIGTHFVHKAPDTKFSDDKNVLGTQRMPSFRRSASCHVPNLVHKSTENINVKSFSCHNLLLPDETESSDERILNSMEKDIYERYGASKSKFIRRMIAIKRLKTDIEEEKNRESVYSSRICFISFADSNLVIHILRDKRILETMHKWYISPAPHPKDIIWMNLNKTRLDVIIRGFLINLAMILFYLFVTYILVKFNIIKRYNEEDEPVEGVGQLIRSSFWHGILQSLVTLFINSAVHPNLIFFLSKHIGVWTHTNFQKYLLFEHIVYLFTSTILVPLLASMIAIWRVFDGDVDLLSREMGRILINTSWKYVTIYLINATFIVPCNQLMQMSPLAMRYFNQMVFNTDDGIPFFDLGYWYAYHLALLTLVLSFGLFTPYLLPLAALYFVIRFYVDRHNIAYSLWQFPFDTSGDISKTAIKSMLLCVSIMQFMMSGVFSQNKNLPHLLIAILYIAPVTTWLVMYGSYTDTIIQSISSFYEINLKPLSQKMIQIIQVCYMHPCDIKDLIEFNYSKK
ncbi:hypothetical protein MACK_003038 [Theileria orientalis]|uniref:Integral membrane protein n=1 Tax=Theileria orientalis TaxID=68886 RepID=A0A976MEH5_THEOR|nr:hypothetical protein MACK_003038 [Theileria orientalis]